MNVFKLFLILSILLVASPLRAELIEVRLSELEGIYPPPEGGESRYASFRLPAMPSVVHAAWIRLRGTAGVSTQDCPETGLEPLTLVFIASMEDDSSRLWFASGTTPEDAGEFAWTTRFQTWESSPASWDFLFDEQGLLGLSGVPGPWGRGCGPDQEMPSAFVEEATLILDAEFPVQVESTSWGLLKHLYR